MSTSVVVVTYRRLEHLPEIMAAWLKESADVWLCDCSPDGAKGIPAGVNVVHFSPDPGNRVRHAISALTSGDLVIKADDDVIPSAGMAARFEKYQADLGPCIMGVHGRTFQGRSYYRNTTLYGGKHLEKPQRVDFCGVVTCTPRAFLAMDLRHCATEVEDLYWQMQCYPHAPKFVVPMAYTNLPECKDSARLCGSPAARAIREKYYERWYVRNYRPADRITG